MKYLCLCLFSFFCLTINAQLSEESVTGSWKVKAITIDEKEESKVKKKLDDIFLEMVFTFEREGILKVSSEKKKDAELSDLINMLSNQKWHIDKETNIISVRSVKDRSKIARFGLKKSNEGLDFIFTEVPPFLTIHTTQIKSL